MTHQEIFEKAITKAIDGGWKGLPYLDYMKIAGEKWRSDMIMGEGIWMVAIVYSPPHDFARALWGEDYWFCDDNHRIPIDSKYCHECDEGYGQYKNQHWRKEWEWQLMNMVLADDPIAYLGDNI